MLKRLCSMLLGVSLSVSAMPFVNIARAAENVTSTDVNYISETTNINVFANTSDDVMEESVSVIQTAQIQDNDETEKESVAKDEIGDDDWEKITHTNKISTALKYNYLLWLYDNKYIKITNRENMKDYESNQYMRITLPENEKISDTWLGIVKNEENGSIYSTRNVDIYEWNGYMVFMNHVSNEKIADAHGIYTFNGLSKIIQYAEVGGFENVSYERNDKVLPYQDLIVTFDANSTLENPKITLSVKENGSEILSYTVDKVESSFNDGYYMYFIDKEKGEKEILDYQKKEHGFWMEDGQEYHFGSVKKNADVIAHLSCEADGYYDLDSVKEVSSNGKIKIDYYVLEGRREVLVLSGNKGMQGYYKLQNQYSAPSMQVSALSEDTYVTLPFDKITNYYDDAEDKSRYKFELLLSDGASMKMNYINSEYPAGNVEFNIGDLHITKSYDEMEYTENMPMFWYKYSGGVPDYSPENVEQLKSLGVIKHDKDIEINIDDNIIDFPDAKPFIDENDRTQVPVRAVAQMLNCKVEWQQDSQTVTITKDTGETVKITIGSEIILYDGKETKMDTKAVIENDRTYIPIRFVAEAFGLKVNWE